MGNILLVIVAIAGLGAAGASLVVSSGRARAAAGELDAAREEHRRVAQQLAKVEAERDALGTERDELARTRDTMADERDRAWATVTEEERRRADAEEQATELRELLNGVEVKEADGCWALLLANIERRWAAMVGGHPNGRGVHLGAVADQLAEALERETDRLREEVGVDISLQAEATIEPEDPVLFLLAATDLLNLLATGCQQVTLTLDGALTLTGSEWSGTPDELEQARQRILAAGATVDPLGLEANPIDHSDDDQAEAAELKDLADGFLPTMARETYQVRIAVHP